MIAAEQKARAVYDNILRLSDDPDVNEVIKFLRQREIVHFQRFGELQRPTLNDIVRYTAVLKDSNFFITYIGVAKNVNILPTQIFKKMRSKSIRFTSHYELILSKLFRSFHQVVQ